MSAPWVTADLGNTRLKLRAWSVVEGGSPARLSSTDMAGEPEAMGARLAAWIAGLEGPARAALSSVANASATESVRAALAAACGRPVADPDPELENRTRVPELVGVDRLWAARGALAVVGVSCLVVDAGTALTVDAVRLESGGAALFLGGAIAPGPELLARSLSQWAARLPEVEPRPGVHALGEDTEAAIRSGVGVGFRGSARELARRIAQEARLEGAPVVVTGGASSFLLTPDPVFEGVVHAEEDLVHRGLLWAAPRQRGDARA